MFRRGQFAARLIEMLYSGERVLELAKDPEITSPEVHKVPDATPDEGVGIGDPLQLGRGIGADSLDVFQQRHGGLPAGGPLAARRS